MTDGARSKLRFVERSMTGPVISDVNASCRPWRGFIAEIERCLDAAAERPATYAAVDKDVRRVVANRFPFSVYFRAKERRIVVLAVFHGRRNRVIWQHRT